MPYNSFTQQKSRPEFVNKNGTSFWLEVSLSKYSAFKFGDKVIVFRAETIDGFTSYVIIDYRTSNSGVYIKQSQSYEGVCYYIDFMYEAENANQ
jgi:hypothetical protein